MKLLRHFDQNLHRYFNNTAWLLFEKVFRLLVGFFVVSWIAKYLGPELFGTYNYAQSIVALFIGFATLGLDNIIVRELVKDIDEQNKILGTIFFLKLFGSFFALLVSVILVIFLNDQTEITLFVGIIALSNVVIAFNVIDSFYQSKVLSKYVVIVNSVAFFVSSIIKILLIYYEAELLAFVGMFVIDKLFLSLGYIYIYQKSKHSIKLWNFETSLAIRLLKDSWPMIFSGTVLMIQARIDQVMLNNMVGPSEVGQYSTALMIIEAAGFLAVILKQTLTPPIVNSKVQSQELYEYRMLNYYRMSFILFLLVAGFLYFAAEPLIVIFFGAQYLLAVSILKIYSLRLFFSYMGMTRSVYILTENLFVYSLVSMAIGSIVNVGLNLALIPEYHSQGAIIATLCSFFVTVFLIDVIYQKTRNNFKMMIISMFTFYKFRVK